MSIFSAIQSRFHALSKKFSRHGLYDWLDDSVHGLRGQNLTILNVGSGGEIFARLKTLDSAKIIQIDIDPERKPDIVADVCQLTMFENNSVDAVFMLEVLEHVKTPQEAVTEILRVLKPGGKLYLSTPFIFPIHDEPYDFYRYTHYGLAYLLRDYTEVKIRERNDYLHAIMVLFARCMVMTEKKDKLLGLIIFAGSLVLYPILWLLSRFFRNFKATTGYVTTARKPQ